MAAIMVHLNVELILAALIVFAGGLYWRVYKPAWMGFSGKTLWDWMTLLSFPILLAFATVQLNHSREAVEQIRAQEESLQNYIDRLSKLILDHDNLAEDPVRLQVAEAQTEIALNLVAGERAARVLRFLMSVELLEAMTLEMRGLDLSAAELKGVRLNGKNLEDSRLFNADLEDGQFRGVDFEGADLRYADLKNADMRSADFEGALMRGADLDHADLRGADLSQAPDVSDALLADSCVDATTQLPNGVRGPAQPAAGCSGVADD